MENPSWKGLCWMEGKPNGGVMSGRRGSVEVNSNGKKKGEKQPPDQKTPAKKTNMGVKTPSWLRHVEEKRRTSGETSKN